MPETSRESDESRSSHPDDIPKLQALIAAAREERAAWGVMLRQIEQSCPQGEQLDAITVILRRLDETASNCAAIQQQINDVARYTVEAHRLAADAMAVEDAHLQRNGEDVQRLTSEVQRIRAEGVSLARRVEPLEAMAARWREVEVLSQEARETQAAIAALRGQLLALQQSALRPPAAQSRPHGQIAFALVPRFAAAALIMAAAVLAGYFRPQPVPGVEPPATPAPMLMAGVPATAGSPSISDRLVVPPVDSTPTTVPKTRPVTPRRASANAAAASTGRLVVTSTPSGARVTVNGIAWGSTPATLDHLPLGPKRVRVVKDGYVSEEVAIGLTPQQPRSTVQLTLRPRRETPVRAAALSSTHVDPQAMMAMKPLVAEVAAAPRADDLGSAERARTPSVIRVVGRVVGRVVRGERPGR
jgi:hypothetical protein